MLPAPDYARNMRLIGHSDQGGRPDGVQIMVHRGYAYVGHMFSKRVLHHGIRGVSWNRSLTGEACRHG